MKGTPWPKVCAGGKGKEVVEIELVGLKMSDLFVHMMLLRIFDQYV